MKQKIYPESPCWTQDFPMGLLHPMWCSFLYSLNKPPLHITCVPSAGHTAMNKIQHGCKRPMTWASSGGQTYRQWSHSETIAVGPQPQNRGSTWYIVVGNLAFKEQKFPVITHRKVDESESACLQDLRGFPWMNIEVWDTLLWDFRILFLSLSLYLRWLVSRPLWGIWMRFSLPWWLST